MLRFRGGATSLFCFPACGLSTGTTQRLLGLAVVEKYRGALLLDDQPGRRLGNADTVKFGLELVFSLQCFFERRIRRPPWQ
jgi:hypothetical protein